MAITLDGVSRDPTANLSSPSITNPTVTGTLTAATITATGNISTTKELKSSTVTALGTTGTVSLDPTTGNGFSCVPTGAITLNAATLVAGQIITIVVTTSGTSSFVITFNTNFKSTGTLTTGTVSAKVFTVVFYCDGTNWNELSRTTAM